MINRFLIILITIITASCATSLEYIAVPVDSSNWKVGFQTRPKSFGDASYIRELIPKEDDINNWSKIITIQYIDGKSNVPPKEFVSVLISDIKRACPDSEWAVIESNTRSIIYEWYTKRCSPPSNITDPNIYTPQHEIARVIFGNEGIHKASYNEKTTNLGTDIRKQWISNLKNARVEKDGNIVILK